MRLENNDGINSVLILETDQELRAAKLGFIALNEALESGAKARVYENGVEFSPRRTRKVAKLILRDITNAFDNELMDDVDLHDSRVKDDILFEPFKINQRDMPLFNMGLRIHLSDELKIMVEHQTERSEPIEEHMFDKKHRLGKGYLHTIRDLIKLTKYQASFSYNGSKAPKISEDVFML